MVVEYIKGRLELGEGVFHISEVTLYELLRGFADVKKAKTLLEEIFVVV